VQAQTSRESWLFNPVWFNPGVQAAADYYVAESPTLAGPRLSLFVGEAQLKFAPEQLAFSFGSVTLPV